MDEINCEILNLLQVNCRMSLNDIAKHLDISIDTVKKRIDKMLKNKIFWPKIQIRPRNFGYSNIVEIKISLEYKSKERVLEFIEYLKKQPRVIEIFTISGKWDFSIVVISKDANDLGIVTKEIRYKYGDMISYWIESLTKV